MSGKESRSLADAAITEASRGRVIRLRAYFVRSSAVAVPPRTLSIAGSPLIVPRLGWSANERIRRAPPKYAPALRFAVVHHTAGSNSYSRAQSPAIVRAAVSIRFDATLLLDANTPVSLVAYGVSDGFFELAGLPPAIGHGFRLIDFVDGNDDGDFGGVRVIDGFKSLRHDAVIGRNDQHNDVSRFGSTSAHASKRFVAGRI